MKRGFQLLSTVSLNEPIDFTHIELNYQMELPPLYKLFAKNFKLGEDCLFYDKLIVDNDLYPKSLNWVVYEPMPSIGFVQFNTVEKMFEIKHYDDEWVKNCYLPIAGAGFNGGLVLGTKGNERDKIILDELEKTNRFSILADNIFDFVRGLILTEDKIESFNLNTIYKNWGEDFWRVKENEE